MLAFSFSFLQPASRTLLSVFFFVPPSLPWSRALVLILKMSLFLYRENQCNIYFISKSPSVSIHLLLLPQEHRPYINTAVFYQTYFIRFHVAISDGISPFHHILIPFPPHYHLPLRAATPANEVFANDVSLLALLTPSDSTNATQGCFQSTAPGWFYFSALKKICHFINEIDLVKPHIGCLTSLRCTLAMCYRSWF